jgi:hypothetical protein
VFPWTGGHGEIISTEHQQCAYLCAHTLLLYLQNIKVMLRYETYCPVYK